MRLTNNIAQLFAARNQKDLRASPKRRPAGQWINALLHQIHSLSRIRIGIVASDSAVDTTTVSTA